MHGDYIRPQVRDLAAQLRNACLAMNVDEVRNTMQEMRRWMADEQAGTMELGFWVGVMRYCAKQNCSSLIADYLQHQSEHFDQVKSNLVLSSPRMH